MNKSKKFHSNLINFNVKEKQMNLSKIGFRILVKDFQKCFDFYTEKLDLQVAFGDRNGPYAEFVSKEDGKHCFAMFLAENQKMYKGYTDLNNPKGFDQVTYIIPTDDINKDYEILKERGVEFLGEVQTIPEWEMRCAYFRDPEGNLWEISTLI